MTESRDDKIKALIEAARNLPPEQRRSFLDEQCGDDAALSAEISRLLETPAGAVGGVPLTGTLPAPREAAAGRPPPTRTVPGAVRFPGYEVVRELSRGGQGVVYQAIQKSTKRKVAIKVLLEGAHASKAQHSRFEREIELVAQLKHPHIISILHSGTTEDGRQFYVMDYMRGVPLTHYVRDHHPTLEEALQLFSQVCEAVQYAHHRGIIHRDLKPSNILVDGNGVPKLLDFGLAKWMAAPVQSIVSLSEQVIGTLPYISPEQARGAPDEIDSRTDIYSLGVILYEMLTGQYPYPVAGQMAEVLKHIAETPPTPPSRSWSRDSGVTRRAARSGRRGQCPIDDDLQTIVLRTLSKERRRRYQSAGELARDVGRYIAGEPIEAKRDSGWYVLKKKLSRHKAKVGVAGAFAVLILAFGLYARHSAAQTERQRRSAQLVGQGVYAQQLKHFDEASQKMRAAMALDPRNAQAPANAALVLMDAYFNQPFTFRDHSDLRKSEPLLDRALELAPARAGIWNARCKLLCALDRLEDAEQACRQALELDPNYYWATTNLANVLALQHRFEEALAVAQQGARICAAAARMDQNADGVWRTLGTLQSYLGQGDALASLNSALDIDHRDTRTRLMLARLYLTSAPHIDGARALEEARLAYIYCPRVDPRYDRVLAQAYLRNERYDDALHHAEAAVEGGDEPAYGGLLAAIAHAHLGQLSQAQRDLEAARDRWPTQFGSQGTIVLAEKGMLWFDTLAALLALRAEAERLLE